MSELRDYLREETVYTGPETLVYRAIHRSSGARVAIKRLVSDAPSVRAVGRLVHEYQMLTELAAVPGVARAHAMERLGSAVALVLSDPGWRSLERVLAERKRLNVETALRLGQKMARILEGVHAAGVMHKDIKPQNLLVDDSFEQVQLLDFGIASWLPQEGIPASLPEVLEGTLAYISPEQTGRTARSLDARTDFYSFGVTLFEMMAGQRPFTERDPLALVHAHLAKEPPLLDGVSPDVPPIVAAIVAKLLSKDPERRYQTAKGIAEDLEHALSELEQRGQVAPLQLGRRDFSPKLRLPQGLIGRETEIEQVGRSFMRAARGDVELLLIGGPSGIGKTALVRTVYRDIARQGRGTLLMGKHDQMGCATPYAAIAQAFGELVRQWLASPEQVLQDWRARLRRALGANLRLIADVVPELEHLFGRLPAVPEVRAEESLNRLKLTWVRFIRAVTDASPPLVLFLDDMQWADPATLSLLQTLLTDMERSALLVIGAYRDNETGADHGLWKLAAQVTQSTAQVEQLTLSPLGLDMVQAWLAKALEGSEAQVGTLAKTLWEKTRGNPFFLGQLLLTLYAHKLITRDAESGAWQWDAVGIEAAPISDNVVSLMAAKVAELPEETQHLLGLAACTGHTVALEELVVLAGRSPAEVTHALSAALHAGLLIPIGGTYRNTHAMVSAQVEGEGPMEAVYRFLHDRVQQASYERIAVSQRAAAHLEIGRRLHARYQSQGGTPQALFELVQHLNLGVSKMTDSNERVMLAQLNLRSARAAKKAAAYELMANLLDMAGDLMTILRDLADPASSAPPELELEIEIAVERIEAAYFLRAFDEVEEQAQALLRNPIASEYRWAVSELRLRSCLTSGRYVQGLELGLQIFRDSGTAVPTVEEAALAEFMRIASELDRWIERSGDSSFDDMQPTSEVERILADAGWVYMSLCAAFGGRPLLASWIMAQRLQAVIDSELLTPVSPFWISAFVHAWSAVFGTYRRAEPWALAGYRTAQRIAAAVAGECCAFMGIYATYTQPIDEVGKYCEQAISIGLERGSYQAVSWGLFGDVVCRTTWRGAPLQGVLGELEGRRSLMLRAGDAVGKHSFEVVDSYCACLMDKSPPQWIPDGEPLRRGSAEMLVQQDQLVAELARIYEAHVFLIFGDAQRAYTRALDAETFRPNLYGDSPVTDVPLWLALSAAGCIGPELGPIERSQCLRSLEVGLERLRYFSEGCPDNFLHKLRLIEAEHARVQGRTHDALEKYDEAIELAQEQRFLHIEALATQLCAMFHLEAGRRRLASRYMREARDAYARWGASAVVAHLESRYAQLLKVARSTAATSAAEATLFTSVTNTDGNVQLDLGTAMRAAQALTRELDPERVVGRLMDLVLENAGAQRGALILCQGDDLFTAARLAVNGERIITGLREPLDQSPDIATSAVQYAARTRESLVLGDARTDGRFSLDGYLQTGEVRSLLALPLVHQGRLGGVLYLEHSLPKSFPGARVALLELLVSQGAIALENAKLCAELQETTQELRRANEGLEAQVALRTAALEKALKDLWGEMDLAKKIQTVLLPQDGVYGPYDIAATMRPAETVGGDYYDFFEADNKVWVLIGDVSGHGVGAGLVMMMVQTAVRALVCSLTRSGHALSPARLLALVNEALQVNLHLLGRGQYMTINALCLDGGRIHYAGLHQDLLIYRARTQQVERIGSEGVWLGVMDHIEPYLKDETTELHPGDTLVLYTDGLAEARLNGQCRGIDGSISSILEEGARGSTSRRVIERLFAELSSAHCRDDVTVLAIRYGRPATQPQEWTRGFNQLETS